MGIRRGPVKGNSGSHVSGGAHSHIIQAKAAVGTKSKGEGTFCGVANVHGVAECLPIPQKVWQASLLL